MDTAHAQKRIPMEMAGIELGEGGPCKPGELVCGQTDD